MYDLLWQKRTQLIILCSVLALLSSLTMHAQLRDRINQPVNEDKLYAIGIVIMGTQNHFQIDHTPRFLQYDSVMAVNPENTIGLGVGGLHTFRLSKRIDVRAVFPQLLFVSKAITYNLKYPTTEEKPVMKKNVESILLGLPIQVKLKSDRINNFRVYMMGGIKFEYDLTSKASSENAQDLIKLKKSDFGIEAGIGFNFYMRKYFILSPEIKISNGITNVHSRDPNLKFSNVIDRIQSRQVIFSLIFEG